MEHRLAPADSITYIKGGHGKFTLVGKERRFTFELSKKEDSPIFVRVKSGPDDESTYIGFIDGAMRLRAGAKGREDAPSFKALAWYLNAWRSRSDAIEKAEFWHEGTCGACGRTLTVPESIERGIGPICLERLGQ